MKQVSRETSLSFLKMKVLKRKNSELQDDVDALCSLAHALGDDFNIFISSND